MSLYLVPATRENLETSIEKDVDPTLLAAHLSKETMIALQEQAGAEGIYCWAMTASLRSQFEAMQPGDIVLLSERDTKHFTHSAQVTGKAQSKSLGEALWPIKGERPWELIYFLRNIRRIRIPKSEFVMRLGYKPNDAVAGTRRVPEERVHAFESVHGSISGWLSILEARAVPDALREVHDAERVDYSAGDVLALAKRRLEHEKFAKQVKMNYGKTCAMCDIAEDAFLVAGHIVAWSEDPEHRLNPANGLCLCVLHDRAFELGYLVLDEQYHIRRGPLLKLTSALGRQLESVVERRIRLPTAYPPNLDFLKRHRDKFILKSQQLATPLL